jgi:hypothetical protein
VGGGDAERNEPYGLVEIAMGEGVGAGSEPRQSSVGGEIGSPLKGHRHAAKGDEGNVRKHPQLESEDRGEGRSGDGGCL